MPRFVRNARRWLNGLSWVTKIITGIAAGFAGVYFTVTPLILWGADHINETNGYTKQPWVIQYVQQQQAPLQGAIQNQSSFILRKWWNENRWAIQALEDAKSRRLLSDWERRKLNDLHDERDTILLEYKKAGLPPPST